MATMTVFGAVAVAAPARVRAQWPARSPMQARPARVGRSAGRVSLVPRAAKKSAPKAPVEQPTEAAPVEAPTTPSSCHPASSRGLRSSSCVPRPLPVFELTATRSRRDPTRRRASPSPSIPPRR